MGQAAAHEAHLGSGHLDDNWSSRVANEEHVLAAHGQRALAVLLPLKRHIAKPAGRKDMAHWMSPVTLSGLPLASSTLPNTPSGWEEVQNHGALKGSWT